MIGTVLVSGCLTVNAYRQFCENQGGTLVEVDSNEFHYSYRCDFGSYIINQSVTSISCSMTQYNESVYWDGECPYAK